MQCLGLSTAYKDNKNVKNIVRMIGDLQLTSINQ